MTGIRREFAGHPSSRHQENPLNDITLFPPPLACASQDRQTPLCPRPSPPHTMSEDHASKHRKASRSAITNPAPAKQLVRARPGSPSQETQDDTRPAKRTRKAINCEPCRGSKLKCDRSVRVRIRRCGCLFIFLHRNRPCSSCVLRGESVSFVGFTAETHDSVDGFLLQGRSRYAIKV